MREEGIEVERLSPADVGEIEPGIAAGFRVQGSGFRSDRERASDRNVLSTQYSVRSTAQAQPPLSCAFLVPGEAQLRNPWHLRALVAACQKVGVTMTPQAAAGDVRQTGDDIAELMTSAGPLRARQYCFTAGAWTGLLLKPLSISTGILPIRGQMVLFRCDVPSITRIINEGSRYLVPREDGRVLAGSTEEEVGFDKRTTEEAIGDLADFARELVPALREATIEKTWAGLRPGSFDGLPYLGRLPGLNNAYIAAGHFRSGLFLSTATAVTMSQLIRGEQPQVDLSPFRVSR